MASYQLRENIIEAVWQRMSVGKTFQGDIHGHGHVNKLVITFGEFELP
jgi:hypothetical protein